MKARGRTVVALLGAGAAVVLAAAAILGGDRFAEEWYLGRLRTGGEEAKVASLRWLGEHGEERAFEEILLDLDASDGDRSVSLAASEASEKIEARIGRKRLQPVLLALLDRDAGCNAVLIVYAVAFDANRWGWSSEERERALRRIIEHLRSRDPGTRRRWVQVLERFGRISDEVALLAALDDDPDPAIVSLARRLSKETPP